MLSNVRRKIVQKDIKKYSELRIEDWWNSDVISYLHKYSNFGNPRYSKKKVKKTFEKPKLSIFVPYEIDGKIYNMIPCPSASCIKEHEDPDTNKSKKMKMDKPFLLGETEITQEIYESVMGVKPSYCQDKPKNPVEKVSWYDAIMFCNKLSDLIGLDHYYYISEPQELFDRVFRQHETHYDVGINESSKGFRLPTECEWVYAAKAGTQLKFSGSDNADEVAWYKDNSKNTTHPVKQKKPNAWGFYDMTGNVDEWCEDVGKREKDTMYPSLKEDRVLRRGNYNSELKEIDNLLVPRSKYSQTAPNVNFTYIGFRVCRYI
jgi:formylglycine-generating enzyme required for sulfatase activity